jgi:raffinose/stachyose/melibiose transport system permease protein
LLLALPGVLFVVAFHLAAPVAALRYAFTDWDGLGVARWVGLQNFRDIFGSSTTSTPLFNTLKLAAVVLVLSNVIGCALALGLNRTVKSRIALRLIFFLPFVLSPLATSYIWQYIFTFDGGLNQLLGIVGLDSLITPWLGDPRWALWAVAVVLIWQFSGLTMIIYLAGLQGIPPEIEEAAAVDGATAFFRLRKVTLPLLAPAVTVSATLILIIGLRVFDQVIALTGGGPAGATETLATQVWQEAFGSGRYGYGAALSVVLSALVTVLALSQLWFLRMREARV